VRHTLLIALALAMLYPVIWMVVSSLRPNDEIFRDPSIIPDSFEVSNYTDGWNALAYPFNVYMWNSALIVIGCIVGNLVSCSMAAYAFARLSFSGKRFWFAVMLLSIMLPIHVIIVPQYVLFSQLGWVNTFLPLIVPKLLATDAFFIFLMVQFIRGIPKELDEAARIDGAGHPRIFLQIILPLMVPALATTAIFTFIWTWNDFFSQLIFLTKPELYTVPLALRSFEDAQSSTNYAQMFAMSVVSLIPIFLIFLFGQKFLIKGIATTGIK
jgi:multiple sugar transport system permease protein